MLPIEHALVVNAIPPGVIKDNAAYVANVIDTAQAGGAKALVLKILLGTIDKNMAVLKVMESETKTNDTTLGGTPTLVGDILATVVPGPSDGGKVVVVVVDLKPRRSRYLQLQATAGNGSAGTYLAASGEFVNVGVPAANVGALALVRI